MNAQFGKCFALPCLFVRLVLNLVSYQNLHNGKDWYVWALIHFIFHLRSSSTHWSRNCLHELCPLVPSSLLTLTVLQVPMTSRFSSPRTASTGPVQPAPEQSCTPPHKVPHYHPNSLRSVALGLLLGTLSPRPSLNLLGSTASAGFLLSGMVLPQKTFHFFSLYGIST